MKGAARFAVGWAIVAGMVLPLLALRAFAPAAAIVAQIVVGAIGMGVGAYWSASSFTSGSGRPLAFQHAAGWMLAFTLASCWFWAAPTFPATIDTYSSDSQPARAEGEVTTRSEHRESLAIGPSNVIGAEVVFGSLGGLLTTLLRGANVRGLAPRALIAATGWAAGAVVGGYVAFVGSYLLALIGAALLRPVAPVGALVGFAAGGWGGGFIAALIGMTVQRVMVSWRRT